MRGKIIIQKWVTETPDECRRTANYWMKKLYPEVDWHIHCVHHIDRNPLNNNLNNLKIMNKKDHVIYHNTKLSTPIRTTCKRFIKNYRFQGLKSSTSLSSHLKTNEVWACKYEKTLITVLSNEGRKYIITDTDNLYAIY